MKKVSLNLRLTHKIMGIGVVGLLGLLLVGGIYLFSTQTQARYQKIADAASSIATLANKVFVGMLELRRHEKDFLIRHDEKYVKSHGDVSKTTAESLNALQRDLGVLGETELTAKVQTVRAGFDIYVKSFTALANARRALGLNQDSGLEGSLRTSVHDIEAKLKDIDDARLNAAMLTMRRHEKDFMLRHDGKYVEELNKAVASFSKELSGSSVPAAVKDDIAKKLATYQRDFVAWANGDETVAKEQKAASEAYGAIEPVIDSLGHAIEQTYAQAVADNAASREGTKLQIQIALLIAIFTVGVLAFLIARAVSKPLGKMVSVLNELANGNKAVEIPYTERGDEIGDNARAAKTFKENLLRVEKMEAEQKENETRAAAERDAAMAKMASEFEAAVGGIVQAAVAGDFSQRVALEGKTGLVLNIGTAINSLCENVAKALDDLVKMLSALSDGDLTQRITAEYQGNFATLKNNANTTAERIGATIAEIKASAREVTNASAEISTSTTDLSQRTEEQAASLEETSASMEQISATVKKNAENAQQANQFAGSTRDIAGRGGEVVAQAVTAMSRIEDSSRKIADIIGVIDEIARQTNLLALNAAVEAARAGEAGRGFAVVASEVRSLAQRSSQAAKDIKDLITNSSGQVKEGVELVNQAGSSLKEIVESIKKVAEIVSDIAAASLEQTTGLEQINKAMAQMDEVTQQNSALVEENAATAKTLEHQATAMDERVGFFRLEESRTAGGAIRTVAAAAAAPAHKAAAPPRAALKPAPTAAQRRPNGGAKPGPVGRMQTQLATALADDPEWKEF